MNHLSITTNNNLFASKHYICGPLQTGRDKMTHTLLFTGSTETKKIKVCKWWRAFWMIYFSSPVQDGFTAAVEVVKFLLGDGVVHVHGGNTQLAGLRQLVQSERTHEKTCSGTRECIN